MPYYFTCCDDAYTIFTGINAKENDSLACWGWEQDILFHVGEGMPGAHIYLRTPDIVNKKSFKKIKKLPDFESILGIPVEVMEECLQITKQYSSKGRKEKSVQICITPWLNVKKHDGDNHGTIQFKDHALVKTVKASTNVSEVDRLQETRTKKKMDEDAFRKQRDARFDFTQFTLWNHWNIRNNHCAYWHHMYCAGLRWRTAHALLLWKHQHLVNIQCKITMRSMTIWCKRLLAF
eukprot:78857_1